MILKLTFLKIKQSKVDFVFSALCFWRKIHYEKNSPKNKQTKKWSFVSSVIHS